MFYSQDKAKQRSIDSLNRIVNDKNAYAEKGSKEMLRICTEIYYQSKEIHYNSGMLRAILKMSEVYMNERNYEMALKKISEGRILAKKENDQAVLSTLLLSEGMMYAEMGYTKKSRHALKRSLEIAIKFSVQNLHVKKAVVYRTMARNIGHEGKAGHYESTIMYLNKGYAESKKIARNFSYRNLYLASFAIDLAKEYFLMNKIAESEKYLNDFQIYLSNEKDKSEFIHYYLLKGNIENKRKNYNKAIEYFDRSIHIVNEYKIYKDALKEIYSGKAEAYQGIKDYEKQAFYSTKSRKITDSISASEKKILNNIVDKENAECSTTKRSHFNHGLFIFPFLLGASGLTYIFFRKKRKKEEVTEREEDELLDNECDIPSKENLSLQEKERQELEIQDIKELIELVQNNDKSFHLRFNEHFPLFNQKLLALNPQLSHSDLEYCALIKLKFDTKEIAQYKNVSVSSVFSKKYRIRKKLDISTSENIYTWMFNIK